MTTRAQSFSLSRPFAVTREGYGGNQMWYGSRRHVQTGCGPVALANLYAWHQGLSLSQGEMTRLMEAVLADLKGPVVLPQQFIWGARRFFGARGYALETDYVLSLRLNAPCRQRMIRLLADSLTDDRPPVLLLGPNRSNADYRLDFSNHWVAVTGLRLEDGHALLQVSSWGSSFSLDLDRLDASKRLLAAVSLKPIKIQR